MINQYAPCKSKQKYLILVKNIFNKLIEGNTNKIEDRKKEITGLEDSVIKLKM
jgi:hypothetical protein